MFGKSKLLQKELDRYIRKIKDLEDTHGNQVRALELKIANIRKEKEELLLQITKYKAICREIAPVQVANFIPAETHNDAISKLKIDFPCDFYCLIDVDLDILNVFLEKISQLKSGDYLPSQNAIAHCNDLFNFKKRLIKGEYVAMLYTLLNIKVTSRRFQSFDAEIGTDELIIMLEKLLGYIEAQN